MRDRPSAGRGHRRVFVGALAAGSLLYVGLLALMLAGGLRQTGGKLIYALDDA